MLTLTDEGAVPLEWLEECVKWAVLLAPTAWQGVCIIFHVSYVNDTCRLCYSESAHKWIKLGSECACYSGYFCELTHFCLCVCVRGCLSALSRCSYTATCLYLFLSTQCPLIAMCGVRNHIWILVMDFGVCLHAGQYCPISSETNVLFENSPHLLLFVFVIFNVNWSPVFLYVK